MTIGGSSTPPQRSWPSALKSLAILLVAVLVPTVAFVITFPERPDYVGHYIAGAGGNALILATVSAFRSPRPWLVVAGTVAAIVAGAGIEATIFRLALFDLVDFANQSLGALIVAGALVNVAGSRWLGIGLLLVAVALLAAGFRYAFA